MVVFYFVRCYLYMRTTVQVYTLYTYTLGLLWILWKKIMYTEIHRETDMQNTN